MNYEEAWKSLYDQIKERISEDEKGKKSGAYLDVLAIMTRLEDDIGRIESVVTGKELLEKIEREYMWLTYSAKFTHYDLDIAFGAIRYYVSKFLQERDSKQTEPCDDAISREDAMSMILCYGNEIKAEVMDDIKASMIKLPPVQQKTGHWIAQEIHNCHTDFKCSECGYIHSFMHLYGKPTADYTYCPRCGAKMEEEA